MIDPRKGNAIYYDLDEAPLDDIPFYRQRISSNRNVLELGCGTGRTLIPLAASCKKITGVDYSNDMVQRCLDKIPSKLKNKCDIRVADITNLDLKQKFDLIIAPYRVMQALETDAEVRGFLNSIVKHLSSTGVCILNVFNPNAPKEQMIKSWAKPMEMFRWEKELSDGTKVSHYEFYEKISSHPMVLFPHLIYRKHLNGKLIDEVIQKIKMRCYYPDEFKDLIQTSGFEIIESWGGYNGEKYGEGRELILQFRKGKV